MKKVLLRTTGILFKTILGIVTFIVIYFACAVLFSLISVNADRQPPQEGIDIFVYSNGVHTDIVMPVRTIYKDWSRDALFANTSSHDSMMNYVGVGWGDKGFYIDTKEWADLKFSTAFNAMFFLSTSAMHVTYHQNMQEDELCRKVRISYTDYVCLVGYIENSFQRDAQGNTIWIRGASYGADDAFYEAKRVYNLFFTCNTWANQALKYAGARTCLWTPFDKGILHQCP